MSARLAQTLQEKLGSEGAAEMIAWFDDTQRGAREELRDLNELNFDRFDSRVGERMAELRGSLDRQIEGVRRDLEAKIESVRQELALKIDDVGKGEARLLRWMIVIWVTTLA